MKVILLPVVGVAEILEMLSNKVCRRGIQSSVAVLYLHQAAWKVKGLLFCSSALFEPATLRRCFSAQKFQQLQAGREDN